MASDSPCKADINTIFKRLRSIPTNKQCFDCGANLPTWASVTYGVFLCIDCSATHRGLGVHVTFIRSTQLDTSWTWLQLRAMQTGGNAAATAFFRQHGCITKDSQQKYHSRAAQMYREKLHGMAIKNMKLYGTKLHIDSSDPTSPTADQKEIDFFKEHHDKPVAPPAIGEGQSLFVAPPPSEPLPIANGSLSKKTDEPAEDPGIGPSVDHALSMSPTEAQQVAEPRKVTIGARKPQSAKKGMGAKKSMGAQRVKANFSDLENEAQRKDKERAEMAGNLANQRAREEEDDSKRMASMKLAYKDLNLEDKKREEMMKKMDPKKREQMERLGMGSFGNTTRGTGHSAFDNMQTIKQETPTSGSSHNTYDRFSKNTDDDFEIIGTSGPPKYDSPFGLKEEDRYSNWSSSSSKKSTWDNDRYDSKTSTIEDISTHNKEDDRGRSRKNYEVSSSDEAQKKFGNAKAISSDAYFGNKNPDFETKQNLAKFEGQSSISSADFYGGGPNSSGTRGRQDNYSDGPDLADIKEGVRQGVTKVAGRLSNLANGVINSIQDNYG